MLKTVEAEILEDGTIKLCKPLHLTTPCRALVTVLEPIMPAQTAAKKPARKKPIKGSAAAMLEYMSSPEFLASPPGDPAEMEARIRENRESWGQP